MYIKKNIILPGAANKPIALDIFFEDNSGQRPVVIYAHGFNGFKDWGNFDLIASRFAAQGYVFVKFNFSHNGTTPEHPEEFTDLNLFGNNNYSKELKDLHLVTDWVCDPLNECRRAMNTNNICLIGHSMGGGMATLHASRDKRIHKLITWAAISECKTPWGSWPAEKMQEWKETGVQYYTNSRTKQEMPLHYQLYEDYMQHSEELSIEKAIKALEIPVLICHGTLDTSVGVKSAFDLHSWQPSSQLFTLKTDHVFGRRHPWDFDYMPEPMEVVLAASLQFLNS
jgi:alpha-beta hydrolase superfamily lysophospholipase